MKYNKNGYRFFFIKCLFIRLITFSAVQAMEQLDDNKFQDETITRATVSRKSLLLLESLPWALVEAPGRARKCLVSPCW